MKQSLLRALPFTLALCLALTACGAPTAESAAANPAAPTSETAASTAIGAGEAHLLGETYGGGAASPRRACASCAAKVG